MSLTRFGISMETKLLEKFDRLIHSQSYTNRSEAIRDLIRDRIVGSAGEETNEPVIGVITLSYSHHSREITDVLTELQHEHHKNIISTTHVHLDAHNCMEVILVRGKGKEVARIANRLISTRGVNHGKLTITKSGSDI